MTAERADVAVAGTGPAGLALAAACADRGLDVVVVAPRPTQQWGQTYGLWTDEAVRAGLEDTLAARWTTTVVHARPGAPHRLARGYGLVDNDALAARLRGRLLAGGGRLRQGRAAAVDAAGLRLADGDRIDAAAVVDASGHGPALVERRPPAAFQSAFGLTGRFAAPPGEVGAMTLMDLRDPRPGADSDGAEPTFLYAADLGAGRWFAEETSLASRRPLPFDRLHARLRGRLAAMGAEPVDIEAEERCVFPMGVPLPPRSWRVIPFGAAAGMVHPASGYQVGAALSAAPGLAAAVADALAGGAGPREVTAAGWTALWSGERRRQRALQQLGLEALLRFDQAAMQRFFAAFFDLPEGRWRAYLSGDGDVAAVRRAMLTLFRRAGPLAVPLARTALGPARRQLAGGLGLALRKR